MSKENFSSYWYSWLGYSARFHFSFQIRSSLFFYDISKFSLIKWANYSTQYSISGPFYYGAEKPADLRFRPLNRTTEYTAEEMMVLYSVMILSWYAWLKFGNFWNFQQIFWFLYFWKHMCRFLIMSIRTHFVKIFMWK